MTVTIKDNGVDLLREDILPRLANAVKALNKLANESSQTTEVLRLVAKSDAVQKVIDEQSERIMAVNTPEDVRVLTSFIRAVAILDNADADGTELVIGYLIGYLR
jgi:hypothetical protein